LTQAKTLFNKILENVNMTTGNVVEAVEKLENAVVEAEKVVTNGTKLKDVLAPLSAR
jgi:hypothetical protein